MYKGVLIVDESLSPGLKANIAAVLSLSLGRKHPEVIGQSVKNSDKLEMEGITKIPLPILQAARSEIKRIYLENFLSDLYLVIFNDSALSAKLYPDYMERILLQSSEDMVVHGLLAYGGKKPINKICGSLQLLR